MNSDDEYCSDILTGKIKVKEVQNTKYSLAYYARKPAWPVHVILIPKKHIGSLLDFQNLDDEEVANLLKDVARVAKQITEQSGKCRVLTNTGEYQHAKHLHWHVYCEK